MTFHGFPFSRRLISALFIFAVVFTNHCPADESDDTLLLRTPTAFLFAESDEAIRNDVPSSERTVIPAHPPGLAATMILGAAQSPWIAPQGDGPNFDDAPELFAPTVVRGQSPAMPATVFYAGQQSPWIMPQSAGLGNVPGILPVQYSQPYGAIPNDPFLSGGVPPNPAFGGTCNPCAMCPMPCWNAYLAGIYRIYEDRESAQGQLMIPLVQNGRELFFADLRATFDDNSNSEASLGLGKRVFTSPFSIFGGYAFYDYIESRTGNDFDKLTAGLEYLTVPFEARVNGYIPLSDGSSLGGPLTFIDERTLYGIDAEIGWLMADYGVSELRGFIGGFSLGSDAPGIDNLTGPRARMELRCYGFAWGGGDSRLTLGAEYQWDDIRENQVNAMARLVIPLGGPVPPQPMGANRMHRRMYDRIVRTH